MDDLFTNMPVTINKVKLLENKPEQPTRVKVVNIRKQYYGGIAPGEQGYVDFSVYDLNRFALKRVRDEEGKPVDKQPDPHPHLSEGLQKLQKRLREPKEEKAPKPKVEAEPKPKQERKQDLTQVAAKILVKAFVDICGSNQSAAYRLDVSSAKISSWKSKRTKNVPIAINDILPLLTQAEMPLFIEKVEELCKRAKTR